MILRDTSFRLSRIATAQFAIVAWFTCQAALASPTNTPATDPADPLVNTVALWLSAPAHRVETIDSTPWAFLHLDPHQASRLRSILEMSYVEQLRREEGQNYRRGEVRVAGNSLKLLTRRLGQKPVSGWPLFISLHGGGNTSPQVNDQQWQNQIELYQPANALYIAPRAPGNTWDLWHEPRVDPLLDRLIADAIALDEVDPNRVYLMGYSAGGDGVYQLAPRMADRFAAASMMAGHPNQSRPDALRDLPFAIHVGALDDGYGRNRVALQWKAQLDALHAADPQGYVHDVQLHPGRGHWMNLEDRSAIGWMSSFTRNTLPEKVVWLQGEVLHDRLYWLALPKDVAAPGQLIVASRSGQTITIDEAVGINQVTVLLNDAMVDLDQPVTVRFGGKELFHGIICRTVAEEAHTLCERGDPSSIFDASLTVQLSLPVK